jgi:hypothetical protein
MNNMLQMFQTFMQNPSAMLAQRGINVPQGMMNDPNAIMRHLMSTGQISQAQYNQAQQMAQQYRGMVR